MLVKALFFNGFASYFPHFIILCHILVQWVISEGQEQP